MEFVLDWCSVYCWHGFALLCEQKNGVPLSRKTLINHARADAGFFRLICELPQQFIEVIYFTV